MARMTTEEQSLIPPHPQFLNGATDDPSRYSTNSSFGYHSRNAFIDSPPLLNHRGHQHTQATDNPFSPPASVVSFSIPNPPIFDSHRNSDVPSPSYDGSSGSRTPRSGFSRSPSTTNVPTRASSYYSSRPGTSGTTGSIPPVPLLPTGGIPYGNPPGSPGRSAVRESFRSPPPRTLTVYSSIANLSTKVSKQRLKSTLLSEKAPNGIQKPWLQPENRDTRMRIAYWVTYGAICLGIAAGAARVFLGWITVSMLDERRLCLVMDENFERGEDHVFGPDGVFMREVDMSGFGNGEFEMTTASNNNSYIHNSQLYIVPTLTSDNIGIDAVTNGYIYNITDCTFNATHGFSYTNNGGSSGYGLPGVAPGESAEGEFDVDGYLGACSAVSNHTAGMVINPVQSARLNTRKTASIRYGKVEVKAKLPTGDWLWPAIWMLPVENTYGAWPLSGEIDIMESRGNGPRYPHQGSDTVRGSLNWGPLSWLNAVHKTFGYWAERRGRYDREWHTYSLEWTEEFIRIYVDNRLHHMLETKIKKSFWELGDFPTVVQNGSDAIVLSNPWINGSRAAPFDQRFYLILSLAVGGRNGWFPDGLEKPWLNESPFAMADFWRTRDQWYPSWPQSAEERAFIIDSVKMWELCD